MEIHNHFLEGKSVDRTETPNRGGEITPRLLIFHFTAGKSAESAIRWLCDPEARASAHLVIGREGRITQLAPFNIKTWHAGKSH
ncbi:N-acetylmuramoyl-L-alanine amidase, partial [Nitrospinota bacterium]